MPKTACVVARVFTRNISKNPSIKEATNLLEDLNDIFIDYSAWLAISVKKAYIDVSVKTHNELMKINKHITKLISEIKTKHKTTNFVEDQIIIQNVIEIHKKFFIVFDQFSKMRYERFAIESVLEMFVFRFQPHNLNKDLNDFITVNFDRIKRRYINNLSRKMNRMREVMTKNQIDQIDERLIQTLFKFKEIHISKQDKFYLEKDPVLDMMSNFIIESIIGSSSESLKTQSKAKAKRGTKKKVYVSHNKFVKMI